MCIRDLICRIKNHELGNKDEAMSLYHELIVYLRNKYGLVDEDFDQNPTRRGKEWIDIHHILEYEKADVGTLTQVAKSLLRDYRNQTQAYPVIFADSYENNSSKISEVVEKLYKSGAITVMVINHENTLDYLKPYNAKEQLVYANKMEHFVLHYLICSIRGKGILTGGPSFLYDCSISLKFCRFDKKFMIDLQSKKAEFYELMSINEISYFYKKLIDWEGWRLSDCKKYWQSFKSQQGYIDENGEYHFPKFVNTNYLALLLEYLRGHISYEELEIMYRENEFENDDKEYSKYRNSLTNR